MVGVLDDMVVVEHWAEHVHICSICQFLDYLARAKASYKHVIRQVL